MKRKTLFRVYASILYNTKLIFFQFIFLSNFGFRFFFLNTTQNIHIRFLYSKEYQLNAGTFFITKASRIPQVREALPKNIPAIRALVLPVNSRLEYGFIQIQLLSSRPKKDAFLLFTAVSNTSSDTVLCKNNPHGQPPPVFPMQLPVRRRHRPRGPYQLYNPQFLLHQDCAL